MPKLRKGLYKMLDRARWRTVFAKSNEKSNEKKSLKKPFLNPFHPH